MDFDTTPSSVFVTDARILGETAYFKATDNAGQHWVITLDVGKWVGAKRWFAETIESRIKQTGKPFVLMSVYDNNADEWFSRAGNYGIYSRDLHFTAAD